MKTARLFLAALPIVFMAAASNHQAFGPMRFGMNAEAARNADTHIVQSYQSHKRESLTAADVRAQFVSNGSLRVAKNAALESTTPVLFNYKRDVIVKEVRVSTRGKRVDEYASTVRQNWETLQDIADCKFIRKGPKGDFPGVEKLTIDDPTVSKGAGMAEVVTDTWELDGVKIELLLCMAPPIPEGSAAQPRDYAIYGAMLRASVPGQ